MMGRVAQKSRRSEACSSRQRNCRQTKDPRSSTQSRTKTEPSTGPRKSVHPVQSSTVTQALRSRMTSVQSWQSSIMSCSPTTIPAGRTTVWSLRPR